MRALFLRFCLTSVFFMAFCFGSSNSAAQDLAAFEKRLTEFELKNGMKFLVFERHEAPVVSLHIHADVGASDEGRGLTGVAHLFEHMAFKGSQTVGTTDYAAERKALDEMDAVFAQILAEKAKGPEGDSEKLEMLEKAFEAARQKAAAFVVDGEFDRAYDREGGTGLNAFTSYDKTGYIMSLPSNKLELWMSLESDRFYQPVLREFYKERDVVMEERRMRTENSPQGRLIEEFVCAAYKAHSYGHPIVGHMSDLEQLTRAKAWDFFQKYYAPGNLTIGIVGDVDPRRVRELAELYFGRIPARPEPEWARTTEPKQVAERRVTFRESSMPMLFVGYHKTDIRHPDDATFDVIADILGEGRTARLYKRMVEEERNAIQVGVFMGFPGVKYPGLLTFYVIPAQGKTNAACEASLYAEIDRLKETPVTEAELKKAKTRLRAGLLRSLRSNSGLAGQLPVYETLTGDWRNMFRQIDRIDAVTAEDVQRVAQEYLGAHHRTVAEVTAPMAPVH